MKSPSSFRLPIVSHQMCKLLPTTLQQEFFQSAILVSIQKSHILTHKFHTQHFRYRYSFCHVQFSRMSKAAKKSWCSSFHDVQSSGQIITSHQPMFPWRRGPFLSYLLGFSNTCEVARIWPETFFADFVSRFSAWLFHSKAFEKDDNSLCFCASDETTQVASDGKITVDSMGEKNILKRSRVFPAVLDYYSWFFWLLGPWSKEFRMCPFRKSVPIAGKIQ